LICFKDLAELVYIKLACLHLICSIDLEIVSGFISDVATAREPKRSNDNQNREKLFNIYHMNLIL
jgi:hypothetical protein